MSSNDPLLKRPSEESGLKNAGHPSRSPAAHCLVNIITKSFAKSIQKVAGEAPRTIQDAYGDMTSLFTSSEDDDGVSSLVDLLLGKLDSMNYRLLNEKVGSSSDGSSSLPPSMTRLQKILEQQNIFQLLEKLESAANQVKREEQDFNDTEVYDKTSAREAIKLAKCTKMSPSSQKKRRVLPAESIGYHSRKLKLEYQQSLLQKLTDVEHENKALEEQLKNNLVEWKLNVEGVKTALETMETGAREWA